MIYLLNTPILTEYGGYVFSKIKIAEAKAFLSNDGFISAVGHQGTADLLSRILEIKIPANRVSIKMAKGDVAIVFRLLQRLPEGTVLSEQELAKLDYEFGMLEKVE